MKIFFQTCAQLITMALLLSLATPAWSQNADVHTSSSYQVETIAIKGLSRTDKKVVFRELLFKQGEQVREADLAESIQRLYNTQLFAKVSYNYDKANKKMTLTFEERWTTIPILKFNSGGGVNQLIAGAYDINLFGQYIEGGAQRSGRAHV